jgi:antitoxin FitA
MRGRSAPLTPRSFVLLIRHRSRPKRWRGHVCSVTFGPRESSPRCRGPFPNNSSPNGSGTPRPPARSPSPRPLPALDRRAAVVGSPPRGARPRCHQARSHLRTAMPRSSRSSPRWGSRGGRNTHGGWCPAPFTGFCAGPRRLTPSVGPSDYASAPRALASTTSRPLCSLLRLISFSMVPFRNHGGVVASLTIKGIPESLLNRLRRSAEQHRRSLNGEVLHRLERSVGSAPVEPQAALSRIRQLRERAALPPLTDELLQEATEGGRP